MIALLQNWLRRHIAPENGVPELSQKEDLNLLNLTGICLNCIAKDLEGFAKMDVISVCNNHRKTARLLSSAKHTIKKSPLPADKAIRTHFDYLLDNTAKISATVRLIVTTPEASLSLAAKCELITLANVFLRLAKNFTSFAKGDSTACQLIAEVSNADDFVEHLIGEHSELVRLKDLENDTLVYPYLTLLYHLHFCLKSLKQIISKS